MRADAMAEVLRGLTDRPVIVVAQAGNVDTGGFDPFPAIADAVAGHPNAWLHVDGAFGLWAAVSPALRHLVAGVERADSWSSDSDAHRASMTASAAYLQSGAERHNWEYVLDSSRRARGFTLYATLRSLGRSGVRDLVERCCALARRIGEGLAEEPRAEILNDVVLNQVLVRFHPARGDASAEATDAFTREVITRVQDEGVAWMGGTTWHGMAAMRISVSGWATTEADADRTVDAILRAVRA
jgi:glutamate/tyrosine decarboxylase-like PLP-dependent enzyme